jgi:hypothetical protein
MGDSPSQWERENGGLSLPMGEREWGTLPPNGRERMGDPPSPIGRYVRESVRDGSCSIDHFVVQFL